MDVIGDPLGTNEWAPQQRFEGTVGPVSDSYGWAVSSSVIRTIAVGAPAAAGGDLARVVSW